MAVARPQAAPSGVRWSAEQSVLTIASVNAASSRLSDPDYLARVVGKYSLGPQVITFSVKGTMLVVDLPGQPTYELVPALNDRFAIKILQEFTIEFKFDDTGNVTEAIFHQPNGVFTATRIKDD